MDSLLPKTFELAGSKTILTLETKKQFKRNAHTALKTRRKSALTKAVKARLLMKRRMKARSTSALPKWISSNSALVRF